MKNSHLLMKQQKENIRHYQRTFRTHLERIYAVSSMDNYLNSPLVLWIVWKQASSGLK